MKGPKILVYDIETAPILAHVWGLWDQNVGLNQIQKDWHLLSWSAKWLGSKTVIYRDQSKAKNIEDDKAIVSDLWSLLDEADIVVTHNGKKFDDKKVNARCALHGLKPPSPYKNIDTCALAKRRFGFTSNKLEYLADKLNKKYKKLVDRKYQGHTLWTECLAGNKEAWKEMQTYNKHDVLALEEVFYTLAPWETTVGLSVYYGPNTCQCGSQELVKRGFSYTKVSKFQQFRCKSCGSWLRGRENLVKHKVKVGV